jgi:hypothetical protein
MSNQQILESILNRGASRLTIDDLNHSPIREGETQEMYSPEERINTFMEILEYEEKNERWASGITTYQISQLKQFQAKSLFSLIESTSSHLTLKKNVVNCTICLKEVQALEVIKELPCGHQFHKRCIDPWLKIRASCPIDRKTII